jgi:hypothetical protein
MAHSAPSRASSPQSAIEELAIAPGGGYGVARTSRGFRVLDLEHGGDVDLTDGEAFACFAHETWIVNRRARWGLDRFDPCGGVVGERVELPELAGGCAAAALAGAPVMLLPGVEVALTSAGLAVTSRGVGHAVPIAPRCRVELAGRGVILRRPSGDVEIALPVDVGKTAALVAAALVLDGTALAITLATSRAQHIVIADVRRAGLLAHLRLEQVDRVFLVPERNHAVLWRAPSTLTVIDLRARRLVAEHTVATPYRAVAVDPMGMRAIAATDDGIEVVWYADLARAPSVVVAQPPANDEEAPLEPPVAPQGEPAVEPKVEPRVEANVEAQVAPEVQIDEVPIVTGPEPIVEIELAPAPSLLAELAHVPLLGLAGAPLTPVLAADEQRAFGSALFDLVAAWCRRALAAAWDSGRITAEPGALPFAIEAAAILDRASGRASKAWVDAQDAEIGANIAFRAWSRPDAPHVALARDFELSPLAIMIVIVASAPQLWPELARAYGIVANDPARPSCDEHLIAQVLAVPAPDVARELDDHAPLVRHGVVTFGPGARPFRSVHAHRLVVQRLAGTPASGDDAVVRRDSHRTLDEIHAPADALAALVRALRAPQVTPARIVLAGRAGSGRRTVAAALAAQAGRPLGVLDVASPETLAQRLREIALRGWIPCIGGLDHLGDARTQVRTILERHPGPLFLRCDDAANAPVEGDHHVAELHGLGHQVRSRVLADALDRAGLATDEATDLAARFAITPGTIERTVARAAAEPDGSVATRIAEAMRVLRAKRLRGVARRVERLASWQQVVLPPDTLDSVRSFVGRVRHRQRVFEDWGMGAVATTSRGQTALFQGSPGTGKTLVAGAIARELGYELYRIDVSQVMSKWLGETEKNLAKLFDAAEEGECVLLFDEADSLFTKRTEVRSSNDRYANLEVNYLLQRLDDFEGIAILTTNFGSAIDPAFRRRLSTRVTFPFPDEDMRLELWRAHLPAGLPTSGDLELARLASRFQLSGGYIRNAVLRAAYLAAAEDVPIGMRHLRRAATLEYAAMGMIVHSSL